MTLPFSNSFTYHWCLCLLPNVAADVLLWKRRRVSFGVMVVATVAWVVYEWSGLSFLSICSDVLLILIVLLFLRANYAALRNKYEYLSYSTYYLDILLL